MWFKLQVLIQLLSIKTGRLLYESGLLDVQKFRLGKFRRVLQKSPYYRKLLRKNDALSDLPIMGKAAFMENFDAINTRGLKLSECMEIALRSESSRDFSPMINGVSVGLSTGTSGSRGLFLVSEKERARWVALVLDRVTGFSFRPRKVAFFLRANNNLYQSVKSGLLQFAYYDLFQPMEISLAALARQQPHILVAQPSVLCLIAEAIQKNELRITPEKVISVADVLSPEDRSFLERVFAQTIHQVYQCTEGFLAASCRYGTLHFNEDFLLIEKKFLDAEKTRFHPVITDLLRSTQPVVRYELNDIVQLQESCPCGSRFTAIASVEGRSDDILRFTNSEGEICSLFPDELRRCIVVADDQLKDYCLIQKEPDLLQLFVLSGLANSFEKVSGAIRGMLLEHRIHHIRIEKPENDPFLAGIKKRRVRNELSGKST